MTYDRAMMLLWAVFVACLGILLIAEMAYSQTRQGPCGARAEMVDHLGKKYGETPASIMLDSRGRLMEIFSNPETGTWTLIVTMPGDLTCATGSGEFYRQQPPAKNMEREAL